jgi:hypothetical protein
MMSAARTLKNDNRGAVMVFGVFGAVLLTGILYYMIGVGDAIIHRESMQDAADATAYTSAVYHARGMNLICMINLYMAAVLSVLVALKLAQVVLLVVWAAACLCVAASLGAGLPCDAVCGALLPVQEEFEMLIVQVGGVIQCALDGLHMAAHSVAVFTPWVAAARSGLQVTQEYGSTVDLGMAVSYSMVPPEEHRDVGGAVWNAGQAANDLGLIGKATGRIGGLLQGRIGGGGGAASRLASLLNKLPPSVRDLVGGAGKRAGGAVEDIKGVVTKETGLGSGGAGLLGTQINKVLPGAGTFYNKVSSSPGAVAGMVCSAVADLLPDSKTGIPLSDPSATGRLGLPVEDDEYWKVCQIASQDAISEVTKGVLDNGFFVGTPGQWAVSMLPTVAQVISRDINKLLADALALFPAHFCRGLDITDMPGVSAILNFLEQTGQSLADCALNPDIAKCKDLLAETQRGAVKLEIQLADIGDSIQQARQKVAHESSLRVIDKADLGSDYFAVWSGVHGNWDSTAQRGVALATWGKGKASTPGPQATWALAEAEFYFDKHGKAGVTGGGDLNDWIQAVKNRDPSAPLKQTFPEDAMWNMRWRARLRRVCWPNPGIGGLIADKLKGALTGGLTWLASETLGANSPYASPLIDNLVDYLMNKRTQKVSAAQARSLPAPILDQGTQNADGSWTIPVSPGPYLNAFDHEVSGACREGAMVH